MLNKELCKKCLTCKGRFLWLASDDVAWKQGEIFCCLKDHVKRKIKDPPPDGCLYYFQHFVAAGVHDVE